MFITDNSEDARKSQADVQVEYILYILNTLLQTERQIIKQVHFNVFN